MKIAVITPVSHLPGILELLSTKGELFLLEQGSKNEVRNLLVDSKIDTIVCNPNQQSFIMDTFDSFKRSLSIINDC